MLVIFWAVLNRTTLGYEVRAVGFNPDAAAYGGISVRKNYIRAMAISGAFAGLAGGMDMLSQYAPIGFGTLDVYGSSIGFLGIAVAYADRFMRSRLTDARTVGAAGVALGVLAFWLAIPPFTTRSYIWPVLAGALAVGAGIWAVSRGVRRLGWGAVAAGALGICL